MVLLKVVMIFIGFIIIVFFILFLLFHWLLNPNPNPKPFLWRIRPKAYKKWLMEYEKESKKVEQFLRNEEEIRRREIQEEKTILLETSATSVKVVIFKMDNAVMLAIDELDRYSQEEIGKIQNYVRLHTLSVNSLGGIWNIKTNFTEPKQALKFLENKGMRFQRFFEDEPLWTTDEMEIL